MADHADVAVFPPALVAGSALLGFVLQKVAPNPILPKRVRRGLGLALTASAFAVAFSAFHELREAHTPFDVREPTTAVVTTGIYAYTRNPLYLAMMMLYLGIGSLRNSRWHWLLALPTTAALQTAVIAREEVYLERKFGADYLDYKVHVRRWI
jgi:protein-S-isoprenylcysteine O-methyltransferase Ste14